ncbi:class I SAM-dependent methyltransferase [Komagataeibacter oboediens]|uniref:O-methyltransferase n=1 Tax=Komagataeibacter oboediens TaxID=65958 RepID=UPI0023DC1B6E|nr:class I SAM-dependent methyltransferase [Komagataeibacter oboediens]WEQ51038.1 class I SAM-dependent methyltransferase [Komagataeibacter oboediens]
MTDYLFRPQFTPAIQRVLERLYSETIEQDPIQRAEAQSAGLNHDGEHGFYQAMAGARMPVTPEFGTLLYILARSSSAQHIVEFGTSFGVSTIFLAAALRDNGGGRLVTTEFVAQKASSAAANLREAGLNDLIAIRVGDAMTTLTRDVPQPIDLILLDASKGLYLDILLLLEPRLRPGGIVVSDPADIDGSDGGRAGAYLAYLSNPANGYRMASITTEALGQSFAHDIAVRS